MNKKGNNKKVLLSLALLGFLFSCGPTPDPGVQTQGLDVILGEDGKRKPQAIICSEDSYVRNGKSSANDDINTNYGSSNELELKGHSSGNTNERIIFLKFNTSTLTTRTISFASLVLYCHSAENNDETTLNVYGAPYSWSESTITYNNMPDLGACIATKKQNGSGYISFDLTTWLKNQIARGQDAFGFAIKNEPNTTLGEGNRRFTIRSKESTNDAEKPRLEFSFGTASFTTDLKVRSGDINPWSYAMDEVNSFLERKDEIFNSYTDVNEICDIDESEYSLNVDAAKASQTNGDQTQYTSYKTRTIDTLKNYTYDEHEKERYDIYGGLIEENNGFTATGYFHTEMKDDRAYVVDPLGNKYYRVALNALSSGDSQITNRLINQYGSIENFFEYETNHLQDDLGFNSAGAWSTSAKIQNTTSDLSLSDVIYFASNYGKEVGLNNTTGGSTTFVNGVMPIFDPGFVTFSERRVNEVVLPSKDNPHIFGWFLDNELEASLNMLDNFLRVDYEDERNNYSYAVAYTYIYKKLNKTLILADDINDELRKEFRAFVYERYYRVTTEAIRKVDPNHMIIGCRFLRNCYQDEMVMNVAGYYGDIVSFNYYNTWTADADLMNNVYRWAKKPFIVTEWYAKGMDACTPESGLTNLSGAGWTVRTQADRGKFYQNYALRLMEAPYCVGFDYFKMWDNNPADTSADTSNTNSNKGIYTINHGEYTDLTSMMERLNKNKYSLLDFLYNR